MKEKILNILQEIHPDVDFEESKDFIKDGCLDSFDMVVLVRTLNKEFNILILGKDVMPENFMNIEAILNMVKKYQ